MDIPAKIDAIIRERKKMLPQIEAALERARKARKVVERLDVYRSRQNDMPDLAANANLAGIDLKPFLDQQSVAVAQLEQLYSRFARDEIKICFVGRARQGKSLVLQRISGLEGDVIPSSDGSHCTGTRSTISNRPNMQPMAEIDFFSEQEYVGIVNSYLKEIYKGRVPLVSSAAGISDLDLEQLKAQIDFDQLPRWDRLQKLIEHAHEFQGKFGNRITVSRDKIESYVAQYSQKDKNEQYYTYLGVKQANILAPFPFAQCGKIVLVDTIGTGDVALGVEDEMLATVKDSDAILLMLRPDAMANIVYSEDYETALSIARTVTPEYTNKMLFWLLNRVEEGSGRNADRIPAVMKQISDQNLPIAQCLNVNCLDQNDVEQNLLVPVLEQMAANLSSIDRLIMERTNRQLAELEAAYHLISSRVERALGASINGEERRNMYSDIKRTIDHMTNELKNLYLRRDAEKDKPCVELKNAAQEKLRHVVKNIPSNELILQWLNRGTIHKFNALDQLSTQLRLQIINDFLDLNDALHKIVLDMKREVVNILSSPEYGRLGPAVGADTENPDVWLRAFYGKLDEEQFPLIRSALKPLEDFDIRMENFLIYKVRRCLAPIDWHGLNQPPQLINEERDRELLAAEIREELQHFLEEVHQGISDELDGYYVFPNTALFAVLRDFYDRIICATNEKDEPIETEWRYFYEDKIPMIWPNEHKNFIGKKEQAEEWRIITEEINACAADGYFRIDWKGEVQ